MHKPKSVLSKILSTTELAKTLDLKENHLSDVLGRAPSLYRKIQIEKSDGTYRTINAPSDLLKTVQRAMLDKILITTPLPKCAYGFGKSRSIVDNARLHLNSPYLLNADIKDFFPSVHYTRVRKLFITLGSNSLIADALTGLTTLNHSLPQGAPTSPYIATLVLRNLDSRLMSLCRANRLIYSRYFDDITISGDKRAHKIVGTVEETLNKHKYEMHKDPKKLRLSGPNDEKLVTGIRIKNGKLSAPSSDSILEYIFLLQRKGMAGLRDDNPLKEQTSLRGKINFIQQVDSKLGLKLATEFEKILW